MMSVGCLSKEFIFMVLLMFCCRSFIKRIKRKNLIPDRNRSIILVVMATFVLPVISNTVSGNIAYGGDSRGGDTSVVRQLVSMVKHRWQVSAYVRKYFQWTISEIG